MKLNMVNLRMKSLNQIIFLFEMFSILANFNIAPSHSLMGVYPLGPCDESTYALDIILI